MPTVSLRERSHSFSFLTVLQPPAPSLIPSFWTKDKSSCFQDNGDHQKRIPSASVLPSCCLHTHLWFFPSCPGARRIPLIQGWYILPAAPYNTLEPLFSLSLSSSVSADSFVVVQSPSRVQLLVTPWTAAHSVPHHLPEFVQDYVHCIGDAIQPTHPLTPSSPSALYLSWHQGLFNESSILIWWPKYWSCTISPSSEYSGLISFQIGLFDLLAVQGTLGNLLQHLSSKTSILWPSAFFPVQLSQQYVITGKTIAWLYRPLLAE